MPSHRLESLEARVVFSADPISPDHELWAIPEGEVIIDGVLDDAAWEHAQEVFRTQATRDDRAAFVRMLWNNAGLYLSAEVEDENLWADGNGNGDGNRWEVEADDSITFYFDPDGSRDEWLQSDDYAFGVNLGAFSGDTNGSGAVRRYKYITGDGAGGAPDGGWFGSNWFDIEQAGGDPQDYYLPPGTSYASTWEGTINDASDTDEGWSTEIFLPWSALGMSAPSHGQTFGMNFDLIYDQSGGTRNLNDNREASYRFDVAHHIDDHILGAHSSYAATLAGLHGPVNYAEVMIIDATAGARPERITDLDATNASDYGVHLEFDAPSGTMSGAGHVSSYEIRYVEGSTTINTDDAWRNATVADNAYVPRLSGLSERLRVAELEPGTQYTIAVRAIDAAGNYGDISNSATFTTDVASVGSKGRLIPSPMGNTLMFENGDAHVVIGDHLGISWNFTRGLFPGDVWDDANDMYHNFFDQPSYEGPADPYFDELQAHGINTMRVYLELQNVHYDGNEDAPRGLYWLENDRGEFNEDMRDFMHNILEAADEHDFHVIFSPFDTFSYDEAFGEEGPWATNFGGPLTDINDFFQSSETLQISKDRMDQVIAWANESPFSDHVMGWEPVSEWDSYEWTLNAEGEAEPGRETEFRRRAQWITELAGHIQQQDPDRMVLSSTIVRDPRGPLARATLYSRNWDMLSPHLYTNSSEEPINNTDTDRSVMPAIENGHFGGYWLSNRIDNRPILNGEWGMTRSDWPDELPTFSSSYTQAEDEAIYRTVVWSGFASGQVGTGLRIAADELAPNGYILTDAMRDTQLTMRNFVDSTSLPVDFTDFNVRNLAGRIDVDASARTVHAWGVSNGEQGIAYLLNDGNVGTGLISGSTLTIEGLMRDRIYDVEFWSTGAGVTGPVGTVSGTFAGDGELSVEIPSFATDLAVKFRARASSTQAQTVVSVNTGSTLVSFHLGVDDQPVATVIDASGNQTEQDVARLAGFRGRVVDMTPYTTEDGQVHLAITDEFHHVWLISGDPAQGEWSSRDITAEIDAFGITGDLTTYQPSWGSIHIAGLDSRGHAVNYWWAPGLENWEYSDLTELFDGPELSNGLTGYVAGWDGLNLAGLNDEGEVVVYWWAPGLSDWQTINMTDSFEGPTFNGQLDAYVTPWGGLNIAGRTDEGELVTYWWAPGMGEWEVANISEAADGPTIAEGTEVVVSTDGGINIFGIDASGSLHMIRWTPDAPTWQSEDVTLAVSGDPVTFPLGGASGGSLMAMSMRSTLDSDTMIHVLYDVDNSTWVWQAA